MEPYSLTRSSRLVRQGESVLIHEGPVEAESLAEVLHGAVRGVLTDSNGSAVTSGIVRVVVPTEPIHPLHWLRVQEPAARVYWRGREDPGRAVACLGSADSFAGSPGPALDSFRRHARAMLSGAGPEVAYFGGSAFGDRAFDREWSGFPPVWFVLPRFELRASPFESQLICNLVLPRDREWTGTVLDEIARLRMPEFEAPPEMPLPLSRCNVPERSEWIERVRDTLELLKGPDLDKIVLARKAVFEFAGPIDPYGLLERVESVTPGCFHFLLGFPGSGTFIGASPERLFKRNQRRLDSEAMAGTRPRGTSVIDDQRLREELLLSDKERREHGFVEQCISENLQPLTEELRVDAQATEMALARGRHLYSRIQGVLRPGVSDFDLLDALHPTPAVGGYPTAPALDVLREFEPFERGWYAGPIGWMGRESAEFAVGIRAGLIDGSELSLYSGAGIVPGSIPEAEWDEIEHKIGDFTNVLGLDLQGPKY